MQKPNHIQFEKLGMNRVGLIKGSKAVKGHIRDSFRYEILRDSWDMSEAQNDFGN